MTNTERTRNWTPRNELSPNVLPGRTMLCPPEPKPARAPEPRNPWLVYPEDLVENVTPTNPTSVENAQNETARLVYPVCA